MPEGKWNIGTVNVHGQAMFGDGNRMEVRAAAQDSAQLEALLGRLSDIVEALPEFGHGSLAPVERASVQACIGDVAQEVKKKPAEQDKRLLSSSIDRIAGVLKLVPSAVNAALSVKSLLGL
jgi:hypothetical protein